MTTTLLAAEQALSKELGDFWSSTTTGAGGTTSLVDTALISRANDWITDETWAFLVEEPTGDAALYDEFNRNPNNPRFRWNTWVRDRLRTS